MTFLIFIGFLLFPGQAMSPAAKYITETGSFFYILDKERLDSGEYRFYVEELPRQSDDKKRYWVDFNSTNPAFELYDNSWFDRFLKPTGEPQKARVGRFVRPMVVSATNRHYNKIKNQPDLYAYYPNNAQVPRTNLHKPVKATDFLQCRPSNTPPQHKDGKPCEDRGEAANLPDFLWQIITDVLNENPSLKEYYKLGLITPPMIAAAAHLETRFSPLVENQAEKTQCLKGECTPYKWGKGIGQIGESESVRLWNTHWAAPKNHPHLFVRNFEKITRKLLGDCGLTPGIPKKCVKKFQQHIANCRRYEKLNSSTSHAFCFKPAFRMFAFKMKKAFSSKTIVWQQKFNDERIHLKEKPIYQIIDELAQGDEALWFATSARLRAGYINRGAMVNLSLQECVNHPNSIQCSYGNLSNQVGRRPSSESRLGTPPKSLGAQILKGEFINRCHIWYFAGLCGPVRKDSLLDQYSRLYEKKVGPLPKVNLKAI